MKNIIQNLCENKKILILGFGREGKSTLSLIAAYVEACEIIIGDKNDIDIPAVIKEYPDLADKAVVSKEYPDLADKAVVSEEYPDLADKASLSKGQPVAKEGVYISIGKKTGDTYLDNLDQFDVIFKSPGVVLPKSPKEYQAYITCQTQEFLGAYRDRTIAITGTKGKSTVSTLTQLVLEKNGINSILGGNIGIPPFELVEAMEADKNKQAVLELSCHQLEYLTVSPHIGVFLNLYEEHLDHYGTYERYASSKTHIYRYQNENDILICKEDIIPYVQEFSDAEDTCPSKAAHIPKIIAVSQDVARASIRPVELEGPIADKQGQVIIENNTITINRDFTYEIPAEEINLLGTHNYFNIAVALMIGRLYGIDIEGFERALKEYNPLPHRLEKIGVIDGVTYYDDSISTIGETTIQAIHTVKNVQTVLIGGMDRGIDYAQLEEYLSGRPVENIILMYETGARILQEMQEKCLATEGIVLTKDLEEAVKKAKALTEPGRACIMSPAAASYGYFKNFEERGREFARLVNEE